jgi:hypothetical protein
VHERYLVLANSFISAVTALSRAMRPLRSWYFT